MRATDAESGKETGALPDRKICRVKDVVSDLREMSEDAAFGKAGTSVCLRGKLKEQPSEHCAGTGGAVNGSGERGKKKTLPDRDVCRAEIIPLTEAAAECLTPECEICPYVRPFGGRFLCLHPQRKEFMTGKQGTGTDSRDSVTAGN